MKKYIGLFIFAIILLSSFAIADEIQCSETMTRTAPTQATPGSTFQVTYTAQGVSGMWGASIIDTVSGGCTFPAGTQLKSVMLSDEGTTKTISVTAPSSGSCTFTGDYQFGLAAGVCQLGVMQNKVVTIVGACTPTAHASKQCYNGDSYWYNSCGSREEIYEDCGIMACESGVCKEIPVTESGWCKFAGKIAFFTDTNKCTSGTISLVVLAILIVVIVIWIKKKK